jgi:predicted dehydrogenase
MNPTPSSSSPAAPAGRAPLRCAIVGTGSISQAHRTAFLEYPERLQVAAVCDVNRPAAEQFAAHFDYGVPVYADYRDLLPRADEVDAVIVILPHYLHFPVARDWIEAGVPLLIEKPITCTLDETRTLRDLAARRNVPVVAGQMWRHKPDVVWLRRWIEADPEHFGALRTFNLTVWQNVVAWMGGYQKDPHWILDGKKAGGGIVISVAIHQLDLVRYLSGSDYVEVNARGFFEAPFTNGAESAATVLLEMSNHALGALHADYLTPRIPYSEAMSFYGQYGSIIQHPPEGQYGGRFRYASLQGRETNQFGHMYEGFDYVPADAVGGLTPNAFTNQLLHFADALATGAKPRNHIDENFNTMACVQAIYDSLRSGKPARVATE